MNGDRYTVEALQEGVYLYDRLDDIPVGEPFGTRIEAEIEADRRNRANRVREGLIKIVLKERARQDELFGDKSRSSAEHLAVLAKKVGDTASALLDVQPRERALEQELVEVAAVVLRWLEDIERSR